MCSLIPDQLRSPEVGYSLTADGASAAASPRSLEVGQGEGRCSEGRAAVLWVSSNDGAQGGDFVYVKELRWATIDAACRHGLIWDHTVFHVVPNWRASPEKVAPSKRNCCIARVPERALGTHTFSLCSRNVTV